MQVIVKGNIINNQLKPFIIRLMPLSDRKMLKALLNVAEIMSIDVLKGL